MLRRIKWQNHLSLIVVFVSYGRFREGSNGEPPLLCLDGIFAGESARSEAGSRSSRVRPLHHSTGSAPHSIAATVSFRAPPLSSRAPLPTPTSTGERLAQARLSSDRSCPQFAALPWLSTNSAVSVGIGAVSSSLLEWARPAGLPQASHERPSRSSRRRSRSDSRINLMDGAGIPVIDDSLACADSQSQSQSPTVDALFKVPPVPDDDGPIMIPVRSNSPSRLSDQVPVNCDQMSASASHTRRAALSREILPSAFPQSGPVLARSCQFAAPSPSAHALRDLADPAATMPRSPDLNRAYAAAYFSSHAEQRDLRSPTGTGAFDPATLPFNREILETALLLEQINSRHAPAHFASNPSHASARPPPLPAHQRALPSAPSEALSAATALDRQSTSCSDVQKPNLLTALTQLHTVRVAAQVTSARVLLSWSASRSSCCLGASRSRSRRCARSPLQSCCRRASPEPKCLAARPSRPSSRPAHSSASTHVPALALGATDKLRACTQIDEEPDEAPALPQARQQEDDARAAASPLSSLSSSFSQAHLRYSMHVPISSDHNACSTGGTCLSNSVALGECSSDQQQHPEDPIEAAVDGALERQQQQQHKRRRRAELFVLLVVAGLVALAPLARRHLVLFRRGIRDGARPRARHVEHTVERAAARWRAQRVRLVRPLGARRGLVLFALALAFVLISRFAIQHGTLVLALDSGVGAASASTSASAQSLTLPTQQPEQPRTPQRQPFQAAASQIASTETAGSTVDHTRQELLRLLETVVNDLDMPLKVKVQRLKKV